MDSAEEVQQIAQLVESPFGRAMAWQLAKKELLTDQLELVLICARDIVKAWPQMTIRNKAQMSEYMDTLRQALEVLDGR
jgi:hypothetical protein